VSQKDTLFYMHIAICDLQRIAIDILKSETDDLQGFFHLNRLVTFNNIPYIDIIEIVDIQSAFVA